ncbi:hypothetical protein DMA15_32340 [Streptomyces sp. WAC 01529]|uniref:hypothetical protein n=1 Tax=Streptomyces sp. WAC 01529 TaxID=2203205 RepID=UPI000F7086C2|nr:hypothetical protein [Streptomyces sp. WAC 01529]AZM56693.1 hypothetical protein DMA15_32340 [Streptomyces sp. WAC 01529]
MEQLSAGQKLDEAFENMNKEKSLSFEFSLDTDTASLMALDDSSDSEPGEEMPDEAARLLRDAKISVTVQSRKPFGESGEKDFDRMAMKISGRDGKLAEYRVIGDQVYFRSDLAKFGKAMGTPVPTAADLPPEAGALKKVLEGEWVKADMKEIERLAAEGDDGPGSEPSPEATLDAATQKKLVKAMREVVGREVKLKTAGGEDGTERITATAPFRTLATELVDELRPLAKKLPPGTELPTAKELKDAPNAKVRADITLKNEELKEVRIDLAKLAENTKVKKFGLVIRMTEGTKPTAPAGATELDLEELMGGMMGGMGMGMGGPAGTAGGE